jgi:acyl-CoA synthetase (AMP-forming)/AMP-acid ligase II
MCPVGYDRSFIPTFICQLITDREAHMTQTPDNAHMMSAPGEMFEIETLDIRGVPTKTWKAAPPTLLAVWELAAAHGQATYLVYEDERISFNEARDRVNALASGLAATFGVQQGDRIAIATRNYPEFVIAFWATISLGAVVVPLNAWWTGPELSYAIEHSGAKVVIADDERLERLKDHLKTSPRPALIAVRTASVPEHATAYEEVLRAGKGRELPRPNIAPDDDATILYTSGTTGKPKGAVGTHRNSTHFIWNGVYAQTVRAFAAAAAAASSGVAPPAPPTQTATLLTFPLFHVGGLQSHLLPYTLLGGKLVLMYKWDPDLAVDLILREDVNAFSGVPTTAFALLERARERGVSLPSLLGVSSGATLVPPELVRQIDTQFSHRVAPGNGYGLTETSGAMVYNAGETYVSRPNSVGQPIAPVNSVKIVSPAEGNEAPVGELGEIWLKGPTVVRGYYSDPAATEASFGDGWFRTGDLGRLDSEGYLYIVDRLKDVVIRGGENVYSAEVEAVLFAHPDITDAAIVGLPHPLLGEEVAAVVRIRDGSGLDAAKLTAYVKEQLAAFKVPSQWWLRADELPRNAAGKVLKRNLREDFPKQK